MVRADLLSLMNRRERHLSPEPLVQKTDLANSMPLQELEGEVNFEVFFLQTSNILTDAA